MSTADTPAIDPSTAAPSPKAPKAKKKAPVKKAAAKAAATPRPPSKAAQAKSAKQAADATAMLLKMVSDPTRLQVVLMLSEGAMHVGAICDQLSMSQPAVSHHLALLRHGGIIAPNRQGKNNFYGLVEKGETLARVVARLMG